MIQGSMLHFYRHEYFGHLDFITSLCILVFYAINLEVMCLFSMYYIDLNEYIFLLKKIYLDELFNTIYL